jgi:hypothetical protein
VIRGRKKKQTATHLLHGPLGVDEEEPAEGDAQLLDQHAVPRREVLEIVKKRKIQEEKKRIGNVYVQLLDEDAQYPAERSCFVIVYCAS